MIQDVKIVQLKLLPNEKGRLMEVQSRNDEIYPGFAQAYITESFPGIIKAWYRHHKQIDQIAVVSGMLKLVLYDDRDHSVSKGEIMEIIMGELAPKLVQIPVGIWHGFQAIGTRSSFLLHLNSEVYDPDNLDEERLPANSERIPYNW